MTQMMITCQGCGRGVQSDKEKCPHCGSFDFQREKIVETSILKNVTLCKVCGAALLDNDLGCSTCGAGQSKVSTIAPLLIVGLTCALAALGVFIYVWTP